jgi:hypothetical protein
VGELGYGEDVDEVEEQLQGRDPLLAAVPDAQHPSMVEPLRHVRLPVSCQRAIGSILPSAVGISYRPNGRVFELRRTPCQRSSQNSSSPKVGE